MSESYLVTLEIPVFSVDTINMLWVCFQFRIKEVVCELPLIQAFSNQNLKSSCAKLFTMSSSSTLENGEVWEAQM